MMETRDTRLQNNNDALSSILDTINNLPVGGPEPILQDKTIVPSPEWQTIRADDNYDGLGVVMVQGDSNLIAKNVREGISIFGVRGGLAATAEAPMQTCNLFQQTALAQSSYPKLRNICLRRSPQS